MNWMLVMTMPIVFIVVGLPMALRMLPPNRFWGVRIALTRKSLDAWYGVNRLAGRAMILVSFLQIFLVISTPLWARYMTADNQLIACVVFFVVCLFTSLLVSVAIGYRRFG